MNYICEFIPKDQDDLKRTRTTPVCTFCKRRKVKCDRQVPCSSCIRFGNHECIYLQQGNSRQNRKRKTKLSGLEDESLEVELTSMRQKLANLERTFQINHKVQETVTEEAGPSNLYDLKYADSSFYDAEFLQLLTKLHDTELNVYRDNSFVVDNEPIRRRIINPFSCKSWVYVDPCLTMLKCDLHDKIDLASLIPVNGGDNQSGVSRKLIDIPCDTVSRLNSYIEASLPGFKEYSGCKPKSTPVESESVKSKVLHKAKGLGLSSLDKTIESKLELITKIEMVLPSKSVIWRYIGKFFFRAYYLFPFLDEEDFKKTMTRLIGPEIHNDDDEKVSLELESKLDFAHLGILLIITRLGYLSLFTCIDDTNVEYLNSNSPDFKTQILKYLLNNPISVEVFHVAKECLKEFELFGIVNITIMQLALYVRLYQVYCPEYGDGPEDSDAQVFNGILFQLAYSLGLNRDPDYLITCNNEKLNNLGRKIWYGLLTLDMTQCLENGDPLDTKKYSFDTKLPYYKVGNSNLLDVQKEQQVLDCFSFFKDSYLPITQLLNNLLDVNGTVKISTLCKQINFIKDKVFNNSDLMKNLFNLGKTSGSHEQIANTLKYKMQLHVGCFFCSLYFYLYNILEKQGNYEFAFYYLIRVFDKILIHYVPIFCCIAEKNGGLFPIIRFALIPGIERMIYKLLLLIMTLIMRIKITIINIELYDNKVPNKDDETPQNYSKLVDLQDILIEIHELLLKTIYRYANRYYYSWIISRLNTFLIQLVKSDHFKEQIYKSRKEFKIFTNNDYIDQLMAIALKSKEIFKNGGIFKEDKNTNPTTKPQSKDSSQTMGQQESQFMDQTIPVMTQEQSKAETDNKYNPTDGNIKNSYENEAYDGFQLDPMNILQDIKISDNMETEELPKVIPESTSGLESVTGSMSGQTSINGNNNQEDQFFFENPQELDSLWLHLRSIGDKSTNEFNNFDLDTCMNDATRPSTTSMENGEDVVNPLVLDEVFKLISQ